MAKLTTGQGQDAHDRETHGRFVDDDEVEIIRHFFGEEAREHRFETVHERVHVARSGPGAAAGDDVHFAEHHMSLRKSEAISPGFIAGGKIIRTMPFASMTND